MSKDKNSNSQKTLKMQKIYYIAEKHQSQKNSILEFKELIL